jgi:ABC-type methionine transport system permease subunit
MNPIVLTIIGTIASVVTMFILIIKFVKEPLEENIKEVKQQYIHLTSQIERIDKRVDTLNETLLNHFMSKDRENN